MEGGQSDKRRSIIIIQARMSSSRLPGKTLMPINRKPMLEIIVNNLLKNVKIDDLVVATSKHKSDDLIFEFCKMKNFKVFRGSLFNVRDRFHKIAKKYKSDIIVRVTGDNVLTSPYYINCLLKYIKCNNVDYVRMNKKKIIDGTGSEVFTFEALESSIRKFSDNENLEHVTKGMIDNFKIKNLNPNDKDYEVNEYHFLGVDTESDFDKVKKIFSIYKKHERLDDILKSYIQSLK